jgi:hypothetical protein
MASNQVTGEWVDSKLAALTPTWESDPQRGRTLLTRMDRVVRPGRVRAPLAVALATCVICVVAVPATRAVAQRIWDQLFLTNVEVLRVNSGAVPWNISVRSAPQAIDVDTPAAAAKEAGLSPILPPGVPKLAVMGRIDVDLSLSTGQLREALQRAGALDIRVPDEWDGVKVGIHVSPIIVATYPDDITLMQLKPIGLTAPVGFAIEDFAEVTFRIVGLNSTEAKRMAAQFTANPSWFLGIPQDEMVEIRETPLRSGKGMLIEEYDEDTKAMTTALIWSTSDRTFLLSGKMSEKRAIAIANATPTH